MVKINEFSPFPPLCAILQGAPNVSDCNIVVNYYYVYCGWKHMEHPVLKINDWRDILTGCTTCVNTLKKLLM